MLDPDLSHHKHFTINAIGKTIEALEVVDHADFLRKMGDEEAQAEIETLHDLRLRGYRLDDEGDEKDDSRISVCVTASLTHVFGPERILGIGRGFNNLCYSAARICANDGIEYVNPRSITDFSNLMRQEPLGAIVTQGPHLKSIIPSGRPDLTETKIIPGFEVIDTAMRDRHFFMPDEDLPVVWSETDLQEDGFGRCVLVFFNKEQLEGKR